jgi:hypothetical protein
MAVTSWTEACPARSIGSRSMAATQMRKLFGLVLLVALACLIGVWLFVSPNGKVIIEQTTGETPEGKLQAYAHAIASTDENSALRLWELPTLPNVVQLNALAMRHTRVTSELLAASIKPEYVVLNVEWWSTCCDPTVINDSRNAGGARMQVQFLDGKGSPQVYVFDVFVRNLPYWGAALGYPLRQWAIRDVYPRGEEPLFWRYVAKTAIQYPEWKPTPAP